jgi:branched-subunit amino acid ABC-type transport system permease component
MSHLTPEKRPLLVGLVLAVAALGITLRWPPTATLDFTWGLLMLIVAASLAEHERRLRVQRQAQPIIRWVALGLAAIALLWLILHAT